MKRNDLPGSSANPIVGRQPRHGRGTYQKVTRNGKPVRGLWKRNDRFYAQLVVVDAATGKKEVRRVPLVDEESKEPVGTIPQAIAALEKLKVRRQDKALPVLRRCPKFNEYADAYLAKLRAGAGAKRPTTIQKEGYALARWKEHLGEIRLDRITKAMVLDLRDKRQADGLKPRTLNLDVLMLRNLLNRALDEGWLKILPTEGIRPLRSVARRRPLVTLAEIEKIADAAFEPVFVGDRLARPGETGRPLKNAQEFADYIRLMAFCGARRDETLRLKWADVHFERRQLTIGSDGLSKNHEARTVDFHPRLESHLREMAGRRAPDSEWLFPSSQRGERDIPAKSFRDTLRMARTAAKLPHVTFHDCRHCFISFGVMSGIDFMTLAKWVGHRDGGILIGKAYGHLADEHRQQMAQKFSFTPTIVRAVND